MTDAAPAGRRLATTSGVLGAVVSQGIVAGSSLVLQVLAARSLGADGLGTFALLVSVLTIVAALANGWIGDSLIVLDRFEPSVRGALVASLAVWVAVGVVAAAVSGAVAGIGALAVAGFAVATGLWLVEETGRRVFMVRREMWAMAANDLVYAVVAVGLVAAFAVAGDVTLGTLVTGMAAGALAATACAALQLPRDELRTARPTRAGVRRLSSFAGWRTGHVAIRPAAQFGSRLIVVVAGSTAVLGSVEAARLALAPVVTVLPNAAGAFLLSSYAAAVRAGRRPTLGVERAIAALLVVGVVYVAVSWPFLDLLLDAVTDGEFEVPRTTVAAWILAMVGIACNIPAGCALAAHERARELFRIRALGTAVGLAATAALAWLAPEWIPAGLGAGELLQAVLLQRAVRTVDWGAAATPGPPGAPEPEPSPARTRP